MAAAVNVPIHPYLLVQSLSRMQQSAQTWKAQAQDNLLQLDQLKGLLEESAFWQSRSDASTISDSAPEGSSASSIPTGGSWNRNLVHVFVRPGCTHHACHMSCQLHMHPWPHLMGPVQKMKSDSMLSPCPSHAIRGKLRHNTIRCILQHELTGRLDLAAPW